MKKNMRIISGSIFALIFFLTACTSAGQNDKPASTNNNEVADLNWRLPSFSYQDQNGKVFGLADLKGKIWLADFFFTRCPNVCPPMTANMVKLQQKLKNEKIDIMLVSFSVDPEFDKPMIIKKFGVEHDVSFTNWKFLTGYPFQEIQTLAKDVFKGAVFTQESETPEVPKLVNHPTQFYLIDQEGKIVKFYNGLQPNVGEIINDARALSKK